MIVILGASTLSIVVGCCQTHPKPLKKPKIASAKRKFPYVDKWLSNEQINQKLLITYGKMTKYPTHKLPKLCDLDMPNTWATVGKIYFGPLNTNPNCTLCRTNNRDTWPHLLSTCEHPYLKELPIAIHKTTVHLITKTLQTNKNTRVFTLTNASKLTNQPPYQTIPKWLLNP